MSDALNALLSEMGIAEKVIPEPAISAVAHINFSDAPVLKVTEVSVTDADSDDDIGAVSTSTTETVVATEAAAPPASVQEPTPIKGKLCLNMIVKNESKIMERMLGSVLSIIDTYCICDTGSTDNTAEVIRNFMAAAGKPGEVYVEPFKNFGYNRTHALERAARWGEYALLLDADMKLVIEPGFNKEELKEKGYSIIQRNGSLDYYNTRIVKTGVGVRCVGPTHEYYDFPGGGGGAKLSTLWINDIGDGGCKTDKFERDIRLLKAGLEEEPRNERYHFYLAQSYNHTGRTEEAYEMYKKRVEIGGWIEEVFYAALEAGNMAKRLGKIEEAIYWWMEAYNKHPVRAESIYEIAKHYREVGKNKLSQLFVDLGKSIPYPKDDVLFIHKQVYDYLFDYEESINCYYTRKPVDHVQYLRLIGKDYHKGNVLSNYRFYVKKLKDMPGAADIEFCGKAEKTIMGRPDSFVSSSPCIIPNGEGYMMNVRYVNYMIRPDGGYDFKHGDGKITTLNLVYWLTKDLKVIKTKWMDQVQDESLRYQGVEDVKVFRHADELLFLGTVENPANGRVAVGHGTYDYTKDRLHSAAWPSPNDRGCEKNWCYFHTADGDLRLIYDWSPLTIAEPAGDHIKILTKDEAVPPVFRDVRGSSNGCLTTGPDGSQEIWFLCHLVQYSTPRHYYHLIVVLDAKTLKFKRNSILFKFHSDCIEYSLGFIVEPERLLFSYSRMDRTSAVLTLPRALAQKELFP